MGLSDPSNISANRGNAVHKALELAARYKLAVQNGEPHFSEDETGISWSTTSFDYEKALKVGYDFYVSKSPHLIWTDKDWDICKKLLNKTISWYDGEFDPLKRIVIEPEQYFELELPWAWAKDENGNQMKIKGTLDLVLHLGEDAIELVDFKTGRRWDWATNEEKTYAKLIKDFQLSLYYYALCIKYPDKKKYVTILWSNDGPFSLPFSKKNDEDIEKSLKKAYDKIVKTVIPKRALNKSCGFCNFSKEINEESGKSMCDHIHNEVTQIGLEKVIKKYTDGKDVKKYTGGGRGN